MRLLALMLVVLTATPAGAQTAVLRLRVAADGDTGPLRRVRVVAQAGGRAAAPVFTDDEGRVGVAVSGGAVLRISKSGFAPQAITVPAPRPASLDVQLAPATVITGRVIDSRGQPAVRVGVVVRRIDPAPAVLKPDTVGPTPDTALIPPETRLRTDDRGEFRGGNLIAGRYELYTERGLDLTNVLDGLPPGGAPEAIAERRRQASEPVSEAIVVTPGPGETADVTLTHEALSPGLPVSEGGVVTGTLVDEHGEPAEGASVVLVAVGTGGLSRMAAALADDLGRFRVFQVQPARYLLVVHTAADVAAAQGKPLAFIGGPDPDASSHLPVYYPGRLDPAQAVPLAVERGRELHGMDMVVPAGRGVRVFGRVAAAGGQGPAVILKPAIGWTTVALGAARSVRVSADGGFELRNVPPGNYALQSISTVRDQLPGEPADVRFAAVRITVGSDDIGPVTIAPAPVSTISGRIALEGATPGISPNDFRFSILPVEPAAAPDASMIGGAMLTAGGFEPGSDWRFRFRGLTSPTRFGLARAPQGWWLKSVRIGAVNAAEEPAEFGLPEDSRDDVEIVLSATGATMTGRAGNGAATPAEPYTVIALAADRDAWFPGSSRVKTTTSTSDGSFVLPGVPPGDYLVAAIELSGIEPNAAGALEPAALAALASSAQRVTAGERETVRLDLRLLRLPR